MELVLAILLATFILGYCIWFMVGLTRYIGSGQYETEKRLTNITE